MTEGVTPAGRDLPAPSEIRLSSPFPLVDTLDRCEREVAAALIVLACQHHGDKWQPITPRMIGEALRVALDQERKPWATLNTNPFARPDFHDLVKAGYATGDLENHGPLTLTEQAIERIAAKHQREGSVHHA